MKKIASIILLGIFLTGCNSVPIARYKTTEIQFWKKINTPYKKAQLDYKVCKIKVDATNIRETKKGALLESCMQLDDYKWDKYTHTHRY
jgi:PBP1b-binding outer membrane lipoprotein LpoB